MTRTRAENRLNRSRVIKRKLKIIKHTGFHIGEGYEGYLNKNKIHCGCSLCKRDQHNGIEAPRYLKDKSNYVEQ